MANKTVTITAKFDGICAYCGQPTAKGTLITKHDYNWVHPQCIAHREQDEIAVRAEIRQYNPKYRFNAPYAEFVRILAAYKQGAAEHGETPEQFAARWCAE